MVHRADDVVYDRGRTDEGQDAVDTDTEDLVTEDLVTEDTVTEDTVSVVILHTAGRTIGLCVDELSGSADIVVKSLSDNFADTEPDSLRLS